MHRTHRGGKCIILVPVDVTGGWNCQFAMAITCFPRRKTSFSMSNRAHLIRDVTLPCAAVHLRTHAVALDAQ